MVGNLLPPKRILACVLLCSLFANSISLFQKAPTAPPQGPELPDDGYLVRKVESRFLNGCSSCFMLVAMQGISMDIAETRRYSCRNASFVFWKQGQSLKVS